MTASTKTQKIVIVCLLAWHIWCQFNWSTLRSSISTGGDLQVEFHMLPDLFELDDLFRKEHDRIDSESHTIRCQRYGFSYNTENNNNKQPRRIFVGMPIADDNMETVIMQAVENYNLFHTVVFSESNRTQDGTPRTLRFAKESPDWNQLTKTHLFGANTNIVVDYWLGGNDWTADTDTDTTSSNGGKAANGFDYQGTHRNSIVQNFKKAGMRRDDVALIADVDEIVSRDFIRAVQYCDIPVWRQSQNYTCFRPKVITAAINFEGSPHCITKNIGFHPDFCIGACVEHIGDPTGRIVPEREYRREYGRRAKGFGHPQDRGQYPAKVVPFGRYPLFSGEDFRQTEGATELSNYVKRQGQGETHQYGISFHIHNFFDDLEKVRNKYLTYGESQHHKGKQFQKHICAISNMQFTCQCFRKLDEYDGFRQPYEEIGGPKPIYFLNATYRKWRHRLMGEMIIADEKIHGTSHPNVPITLT